MWRFQILILILSHLFELLTIFVPAPGPEENYHFVSCISHEMTNTFSDHSDNYFAMVSKEMVHLWPLVLFHRTQQSSYPTSAQLREQQLRPHHDV